MAKEYNITRTTGQCGACGKEMQPGEEFVATVRPAPEETDEDFVRQDFCLPCWQPRTEDGAEDPNLLGVWRSRVPLPKEKRKTFVDDEVLIQFFERLDGAEDPAKRDFRFVLALILMRKKLLVYDRSKPGPDGCDVWTMHFKGAESPCTVLDPHLDEDRISEVSGQLGAVLEADL